MLNLFHHANHKPQALARTKAPEGPRNLSQAAAGQQVTVIGFEQLPTQYRQHLEAYGLMPGRSLQVLAQHPVTIVLVEQTELAFEAEIARKVMVK